MKGLDYQIKVVENEIKMYQNLINEEIGKISEHSLKQIIKEYDKKKDMLKVLKEEQLHATSTNKNNTYFYDEEPILINHFLVTIPEEYGIRQKDVMTVKYNLLSHEIEITIRDNSTCPVLKFIKHYGKTDEDANITLDVVDGKIQPLYRILFNGLYLQTIDDHGFDYRSDQIHNFTLTFIFDNYSYEPANKGQCEANKEDEKNEN